MEFVIINTQTGENKTYSNAAVAHFLHDHLEQYGDKVGDIMKAIEYIFTPTRGGNIVVALIDEKIVGAVVLNNTGMSGYIPENILVYIAVDRNQRGMGVGKQLMQKAIATVDGNIALHVEPDNPARKLYEKLGFESKYLEMRLSKSN